MRPDLAGLSAAEPFDVVVIGAGAHGVWTARHAARHGLRTLLVDKQDVAAGTTSRSTMLAHGGLRYLANLEIGLVHEALQERGALTRMAPHLVRPIPFLLPFYEGAPYPPWQLRVGLRMYSFLARGSGYPRHTMLTRDEVLAREPTINPRGLLGGALYFDGQILSPERLALEVALDAERRGGVVRNHTEAVGLSTSNGRVDGVELRDAIDGAEARVGARCVVNATGPWLDEFLGRTPARDGRLRLTKGVHLLTPRFSRHAIVVNAPDGRTFFTIPWHDYELVGTTDTDFDGDPSQVHATRDDVKYLVDATTEFFPDAPIDDVKATNAGLRNMMRVEGVDPGDVSRTALIEHHGDEGVAGLLSVIGGKLTTARATAHEVLRAVCYATDSPDAPRKLDEDPLPGGGLDVATEEAEAARWAAEHDMLGEVGVHLVRMLGSRWRLVADGAPRQVCGHGPTLVRQFELGAEVELARTPMDVIRRRTLAWAGECRGGDGLDDAVDVIAHAYGDDEGTLELFRRKAEADIALHSRWRDGDGVLPG